MHLVHLYISQNANVLSQEVATELITLVISTYVKMWELQHQVTTVDNSVANSNTFAAD